MDIELRTRGPWALVAAMTGFTALAVYVVLIIAEGNNSVLEVLPWILLMGSAAGAALVARVTTSLLSARRLLVVAAVVFAAIGVLAIFTIGLLFLVAAAASAIAAARLRPTRA